MNYFEAVTKYEYIGCRLPTRATVDSAGYDLYAAEDIVIPSYEKQMKALKSFAAVSEPITLDDIAAMTKASNVKPTLVSTGCKCHMDSGYYLSLSARSSLPLKNWLIVANAPGIVDADYFNNPSNEGEIFLQLINLSPFDIKIAAGDKIGQAVFLKYDKVGIEEVSAVRTGGFGSTNS